jgi:hypothetical protein
MEDDQEKDWPGIVGDQLYQWMLDRLGDRTSQSPKEQLSVEAPLAAPPAPPKEKPSAVAQPTGTSPTTAEIKQILALQPSMGGTPQVIGASGRTVSGFIRAGEPVSFELSFQLGGPGASEMAKSQTRFHADIYARDRSSAVEMRLRDLAPDASEEPDSAEELDSTVENVLSYTTTLPEVILERGTYRLDCLTTLEVTPPLQGYLKVPILEVV